MKHGAAALAAAWLVLSAAPAAADDLQALIDLGSSSYGLLCAKCHGPALVNPGTSSFDLRRLTADDYPRFEDSVVNGRGAMPAWGDILQEGELQALWAYVYSKAGTAPLPDDFRERFPSPPVN